MILRLKYRRQESSSFYTTLKCFISFKQILDLFNSSFKVIYRKWSNNERE